MKLLIYTANLNNFDKKQDNVEQILPDGIDQIDYYAFNDTNFPPRFNSMTPRLQARICKMMAWQMKPGYDYYLWVDSSCKLPREDSAKWFLEQLSDADIAVFRHNKRKTVQEEADYLKARLEAEKEGRKQPYVLPRYENEDIDGQLAEILSDKTAYVSNGKTTNAGVFKDQQLFATTAFIYRNTNEIQRMFKEWWYHTSRYHSIDQLSLPYSMWVTNTYFNVIDEDYLKCKYLKYTR